MSDIPLDAMSHNDSMRNIVTDLIAALRDAGRDQAMEMSVVDLAELADAAEARVRLLDDGIDAPSTPDSQAGERTVDDAGDVAAARDALAAVADGTDAVHPLTDLLTQYQVTVPDSDMAGDAQRLVDLFTDPESRWARDLADVLTSTPDVPVTAAAALVGYRAARQEGFALVTGVIEMFRSQADVWEEPTMDDDPEDWRLRIAATRIHNLANHAEHILMHNYGLRTPDGIVMNDVNAANLDSTRMSNPDLEVPE